MHILHTLIQIAPAATRVFTQVAAAMADGSITGDEAQSIGEALAGEEIKLMISGRDVLRGPAQKMILGGLGRVSRQIVIALRD